MRPGSIDKVSRTLLIVACLGALQSRMSAAEPARAIPVCAEQQLLAFAPKDDETKGHRRFVLPKISYTFGTPPPFRDSWGFELTVRVDELGRAVCYANHDRYENPLQLNEERRATLAGLSSWSYSPFVRNGVSVAAVVTEYIYEEKRPRRHVAPPTPPLEKVHIGLERSGCYGTCPGYRVELFGDGTAIYEGTGYVDVLGRHRY